MVEVFQQMPFAVFPLFVEALAVGVGHYTVGRAVDDGCRTAVTCRCLMNAERI